ncbi:NYN domain-containing protein, partial [Kitasatospora sp. NPDC004272]
APAAAAAAAPVRGTPLRVIPTPKDLAGRAATGPPPAPAAPVPAPTGPVLRWSSDRGLVDRADTATAADALPTLDRLTTSAQRWADREEDITSVGGDPQEVGQVFARRWLDRLADTDRPALLWTDHPRIPHRLDGELLRYAARFGLLAHKEDQIDEQDRYAIREGFWKELAARVPDARQPAGALEDR